MNGCNLPSLTYKPHPFKTDTDVLRLPEGCTVKEAMQEANVSLYAGSHLHVSIDGKPIPEDQWEWQRLQKNNLMVIQAIPHDGGGEGKNIGSIILGVIIIVVSAFTGYYPGIVLGLGLLTGGAAGLIAPTPRFGDGASFQQDSRLNSITGIQNRAVPWGMVPIVYGKHRVFPTFGAFQYTEIAGDDQYLRVLFTHQGPVQFSDHRIGTTPIDQFPEVEIETRQGLPGDAALTIYSNSVVEQPFAIVFKTPDEDLGGTTEWANQTSAPNADKLSFDFTFAQGLTKHKKNGKRESHEITVRIQYKLTSEETWTAGPSEVFEADTNVVARRNIQFSVARGQYDTRVQCVYQNKDDDSDTHRDEMTWTVLRTFTNVDPVNAPNMAKIALRIRATGVLNGLIETYNVIMERLVDVYNGSSWDTNQVSRNPAWAYADVLTNSTINARAIPKSRLDVDTLKAWADRCTAAGRNFDRIYETRPTIFQGLAEITAAGRASWQLKGDGKHSVVEDIPQTIPRQLFTEINTNNYRGTKAFPEPIHALRCQFRNELADWKDDERIVYADGFNESNATKFETIQFFGITHPEQVWKMGRYHLAQFIQRPERHIFETDMEFLVASRGQLVNVSNHVMLVGLGSRRILSVQTSGTDVTGITLNQTIDMVSGKSYGVRIRMQNGALAEVKQYAVDLNIGTTAVLVFTSVIPDSELQPAEGDLVTFGEFGLETLPCLIKSIAPFNGLQARITCINEGPGVHLADQGPIPAFESFITLPSDFGRPQKPVIESLRSDEFSLIRLPDGSFKPRIQVNLKPPSSVVTPDRYGIRVRYKESQSTNWIDLPEFPYSTTTIFLDQVVVGTAYDVQVQSHTALNDQGSDIAEVLGHVVTGETNPPDDVVAVVIENGFLSWSYPDPPIDLKGFLVRYNLGQNINWSIAVPAHAGVLSGPPFPLDALPTGVVTLLVKAIDISGNESLNASTNLGQLGDPLAINVVQRIDYQSMDFPGIITNGSLISGELVADSDGTAMYSSNPSTPMYSGDNSTAMYSGNNKQMSYEFTYVVSPQLLPADLRLDIECLGDHVIEYHGGSQVPFYSGDDSAPMYEGGAGSTTTHIDAGFDSDEDGFTYLDDQFRGTNDPTYASGVRDVSGGLTGAGLKVSIGGIDNSVANDGMSGGWTKTFTLTEAGTVDISFQYWLRIDASYESDEFGEVLCTVDGVFHGTSPNDYIARFNGTGSQQDSGWQLFSVPISLGAGLHTITIGGYNNKKTQSTELTEIWFDDVLVEQTTSSTLMYVGDTPAFRSWPGILRDVKLDTYVFKVTIQAGVTQGKITKADVVMDVPDLVETD